MTLIFVAVIFVLLVVAIRKQRVPPRSRTARRRTRREEWDRRVRKLERR